jgi:hypothetical protein
LAAVVALLLIGLFTGSARAAPRAASFNCSEPYAALCAETADSIGYGDEYTGHDEPSLLFYSDTPGSGNSSLYHVQLPTDPKVLPNEQERDGVGEIGRPENDKAMEQVRVVSRWPDRQN